MGGQGAIGEGGGAACYGTMTLNQSTVSGNVVTGGYGAFNYADAGDADGGGIWINGALTAVQSTITGNTATAGNEGDEYEGSADANGGGVWARDAVFTNCNIASNVAIGGNVTIDAYGDGYYRKRNSSGGRAYGGGVYAESTLIITSSTLSGNIAHGGDNDDAGNIYYGFGGTAKGGAIYMPSNEAKVSISSSQITDNRAAGGDGDSGGNAFGAGISGESITITNSTLSQNTAAGGFSHVGMGDTPAGGSSKGGGAWCWDMTLTQCTVVGNAATGGGGFGDSALGGDAQGGGIFANGPITAFQSNISSNVATGGKGGGRPGLPPTLPGAAAAGGGAVARGAAVFTDCTIANNAVAGGAGVNAAEGKAASDGGVASGGGIYAYVAGLQLLDTTIYGNSVTGGKGGAGSPAASGTPALPPGLDGTTSGGGVSASGPLFNNTIISANKGAGIFNDVAGVAQSTSAHNLIGVGGGLVNGANGNLIGVTNPKLAPLGNYGGPTQTMIPLGASPAIDAGSNALIPIGVTADQRGFARIVGQAVDIGAAEAMPLTLTGSVYNDTNGDGTRQSGELGLFNWQVYIDLNNIGYYVTGDPVAMTNSSGNYVLAYSPATIQPLIVREVRQDNWRRTQPAGLYPLGFYTISPTAGTVANVNFGDSLTALVTGIVFRDINANGNIDTGDAGLSGWQVLVDYLNNGVWQTNKFSTHTDAAGKYSLVLSAGTYRIHEVVKGTLHATLPVGGVTTISLGYGGNQTAENFGNR